MKNKNIPYSRQSISSNDIKSVNRVLNSSFLTTGPCVPLFEKKLSKYCDSKYSVAVSSASSALYISCLALEIKKGDLVWTSPITYASTASCALSLGAKVDFIDIDKKLYMVDYDNFVKNITNIDTETGDLESGSDIEDYENNIKLAEKKSTEFNLHDHIIDNFV